MNPRDILFDTEARQRLLQGVNTLDKAVGSTLGPAGQNVAFRLQNGKTIVTKDGVTVARQVHLSDPHADMGVALLRGAAERSASEAGDGTTTATVLAAEMLRRGLKLAAAGMNTQELRRGMEKAAAELTAALRAMAQPVTDITEIEAIATISSNGDAEIGKLIASLMSDLGEGGVITMEDSGTPETMSKVIEGFHIDRGMVSPGFADNGGRWVGDDCYIVIVEGSIDFASELKAIFSKYDKEKKPPILIMCDRMGREAVNGLAGAILNGAVKACVVGLPAFGIYRREALIDLATYTGGRAWLRDSGDLLEYERAGQPGHAKRVVIDSRSTFVTGGAGTTEALESRISLLKEKLEGKLSAYDNEQVRQQIARLSGGIGVIYVGGHNDAEVAERKARVEDAIHASQGAAKEGVLPGGGSALLCVSKLWPPLGEDYSADLRAGFRLVLESCQAPITRIITNSGGEAPYIIAKLRQAFIDSGVWSGYDALTSTYCDMRERSILDPARVVIQALNNAVAAAAMLLTTSTSIVEMGGQEL